MSEPMTREQLLAMEPGPELDALVAEKVMNFIRGLSFWMNENGKYLYLIESYNPSSDISAAWEVLEYIRQEHNFKIVIDPLNRKGFYMYARTNMGGNFTGVCEFDSAPKGISQIALLAVLDL